MDESRNATSSPAASTTPGVEELLKVIEAQTAARRGRRRAAANPLQSSTFRYGSLVAIAVFAFGSLGMLEWFLSSVPRPAHVAPQAAPRQVAPGPEPAGAFQSPASPR
jgi:hypothetical protein